MSKQKKPKQVRSLPPNRDWEPPLMVSIVVPIADTSRIGGALSSSQRSVRGVRWRLDEETLVAEEASRIGVSFNAFVREVTYQMALTLRKQRRALEQTQQASKQESDKNGE